MTTTLNTTSAAQTSPERRAISPQISDHSAGQTLRNALIITRREVRDSFRDWRIMGPILILTIVFPALAQGATGIFIHFFEGAGATPLIDNFLPLLPMIVGFFPVSISLVIALETFVGEKERRSIEPLLSTPLTNTELYVGKTLAAMLPPLLASYIGIAIYLGGLVFGAQQWRPEPELIIQILMLTTAQALVMVTGAVVVSSQTTSTRAANLLASFIIIPISLMVMLESFIMVTNNRYVLWYIIAGLIVTDIMLFSTGARIFNREELLGRQMDEINLGWAWRQFWSHFKGGATNLAGWYRLSVFPAVRRLRGASFVVVICMVAVFIGGYAIAQVRPDLQIPAGVTSRETLAQNLPTWFQALGSSPGSVVSVVMQNSRVLIAATILATFSFGVMGVVLAIAPFGILGFLFGQPIWAQLGIGTYLAAVVLHSLLELPAIVLAAAAALRLGASLSHPHTDETVGEAWLKALADCAKIGIGLVLPLLVVAGFVEVYITPHLVQSALGR